MFNNVRNIVILRTDRIGEVLLSTPVIEALRIRFPKASIYFVTSDYARGIVSGRSDIAEVITFDTISKKLHLSSAFKLASKLRGYSFDIAVVLNPHKVLHLATFLAGIKYRAGFSRKWGFLLNLKTQDNRCEAKKHEVQYNLELLKLVDAYKENIYPFMPVAAGDSYHVKEIIKQAGITGKNKIVVVHPGSSRPDKRYPVDKFKSVAKLLRDTGYIDIVLVGSKDEKDLCGQIKLEPGNHVIDLSGLFTVQQLAALFKESSLVITNDNGPMHIAAAVGAKVLALFNEGVCGSKPERWGPCGERHTVLYKSFSTLTPYEIVEKAKIMLQ